jgi:hypothetical protein
VAAIEYIVPGGGVYNDTEQGHEPVVPGVGVVVEQTAAAPGGRTTKNTHTTSLGMSSGMGTGMGP